jgi:iron complex outermembrane receptor protein
MRLGHLSSGVGWFDASSVVSVHGREAAPGDALGQARRQLAPMARLLVALTVLLALGVTSAGAQCLKIKVQDPSGLAVSGAQILVEGRELVSDLEGAAEVCGLSPGAHQALVLTTHFERKTFEVPATGEAVLRLNLRTRIETPIVVTGTTEPRELAEVDRSMAVLPVEEPEVPAWSLADVLKQDSSVDIRARGQDGTQADLSIRGSSFDQVLVLVNGVRMNDAQTGHHSLDLPLPFESVSQVEVLHGSGATLYGSDAVGGTINFVTRKPESAELRVMGGVGDFGWTRYSATNGFRLGRWSQQTAVARDFSTGFRPGRDFRNIAVSSESFLDHSFGSTTLMFAYNDRPFGANGYYCACDSWEQTGTKFVSASQTIGRNPDGLQHRFNFAFRRHRDHFILFRYQPEVSQNRHEVDTYQANYALNGVINDRARWTGGVSFLSEGIDSNVAGQRRRERAAAFFVLNLRPAERLSLSLGVREEVWRKWRGEISPTLSAGYWLGAGFKVRGQIGHAFRMPTYTDLYHRDPFNVGNPGLVPETAWNYEGGVDWYSGGSTRASATWFERREEGTIDWVRDPGSTIFQSRNFQELQFHGGEIEVRQRLQSEAEIGGNFTIIRATRLLPENAVSRYVFTFPLQQLSAIYHGPLPRGFYLKMRLGVFNREWQATKALWDASVLYGAGRWRPFFQATNLLNSYHEAFQGLPEPGRWIRGGVQVEVF